MRACFLGQNVTALGFGIAMLQTPPLPEPDPSAEDVDTPGQSRWLTAGRTLSFPQAPQSPASPSPTSLTK